jgi:P-type conjugative transfer protein TrbJ
MNITRILAAKIALIMVSITPVSAGIPVFDGSNLTQNVLSAFEEVKQSIQQVDEYTLQLRQYAAELEQLENEIKQYENMVTNTMAPVAYVWDKATSTMNKLRDMTDTLSYYKNKVGSMDSYLSKFQNTSTYRSSPCFSAQGCTDAEWERMKESTILGSEAQKKATDALFKALDSQQDSIEEDAKQLEKLQSAAQDAEGHMQALGYANQLASNQANQLLQIRALFVAQQNALATRNMALGDKEAKQTAAHDSAARSIGPNTLPANNKKW